MAGRWLFKTEPSAYSFDDLEREGRTVWSGVANALALQHLREVKKGDRVLVYHTASERAVIGEARVARGAYPDPAGDDPRRVVVDLAPGKRFRKPVGLDLIKGDRRFLGFALLRMSRLSVMPVPEPMWAALAELGR